MPRRSTRVAPAFVRARSTTVDCDASEAGSSTPCALFTLTTRSEPRNVPAFSRSIALALSVSVDESVTDPITRPTARVASTVMPASAESRRTPTRSGLGSRRPLARVRASSPPQRAREHDQRGAQSEKRECLREQIAALGFRTDESNPAGAVEATVRRDRERDDGQLPRHPPHPVVPGPRVDRSGADRGDHCRDEQGSRDGADHAREQRSAHGLGLELGCRPEGDHADERKGEAGEDTHDDRGCCGCRRRARRPRPG